MRILSVGGGPAGLYFSVLAKQADPAREITVVERNGPDDTFGFGVVFSDRTLSSLREHDAQTYDAISAALVRWDTIDVRHRGRALRSRGHGFSAIARQRLLEILQQRAAQVGVDLRFHTEFDDVGALDGYDLVLAADGVSSRLRTTREQAFEPRVDTGEAKFIWFGTTRVYDSFYFAFEQNQHGAFATHSYPYSPDRSTFLVETSEAAWRAAGLDRYEAEAAAPGASDLHSRDYCQKLFADHLGDGELLVNNSKWLNFRTVRNARWSDGNVVLVGDAAHTAHFSVGSGTKMAMEDAQALAQALDDEPDVSAALAAYERRRRPEVEWIQEAAGPSLAWWEHFGTYMAAELEPFAFHFLTRNPRVTRATMLRRDGEFVAAVERWFGVERSEAQRVLCSSPQRVPLTIGGVEFASRQVDLDDPRLGGLVAGDHLRVVTAGQEAWRARECATRLRLTSGLPVLLVGAAPGDDQVDTALLAGRADLCAPA